MLFDASRKSQECLSVTMYCVLRCLQLGLTWTEVLNEHTVEGKSDSHLLLIF